MNLCENHYLIELCPERVVYIAVSVFKKTQDEVMIPFPGGLKWHARFLIVFLTPGFRRSWFHVDMPTAHRVRHAGSGVEQLFPNSVHQNHLNVVLKYKFLGSTCSF